MHDEDDVQDDDDEDEDEEHDSEEDSQSMPTISPYSDEQETIHFQGSESWAAEDLSSAVKALDRIYTNLLLARHLAVRNYARAATIADEFERYGPTSECSGMNGHGCCARSGPAPPQFHSVRGSYSRWPERAQRQKSTTTWVIRMTSCGPQTNWQSLGSR